MFYNIILRFRPKFLETKQNKKKTKIEDFRILVLNYKCNIVIFYEHYLLVQKKFKIILKIYHVTRETLVRFLCD